MHPEVESLIERYENEIREMLVVIPKLMTGTLQLMSGGRDVSHEHADTLARTVKELREGIRILKGEPNA